jgi:predicted O-methyltransferase YrrM
MSRIPKLVIDSSAAPTELCVLGQMTGTDKSPFNPAGHRHPYTAVYSLLFARYKHNPIRFAEIGVAMGASLELWSKYFKHPNAYLVGFDRDWGLLHHAKERVGDPRLHVGLMDVAVDENVKDSLENASAGEKYDVIIDDSSHDHEHQIRIIREAFPHLKSGGMLIVEDVFRATAEEEYSNLIQGELGACAEAFFVECEHTYKWSPGWDNDKLLVLVKA